MPPSSAPRKASSETRDFSLRFEMTAGEASRPSPYREQRGFRALHRIARAWHPRYCANMIRSFRNKGKEDTSGPDLVEITDYH